MPYSIPQYAITVLQSLENSGHQAFLVGGSVRDLLLKHRPTDWDICTSATPDQVISIFQKTEPTGLKHGTVTVYIGRHHIEVTTFRTEGHYIAHRKPDKVSFVSNLEEDLQRRDFTVNAMALSLRGELIDLFNGKADLENKTIRCVGVPETRFNEDALRMFRALRFAAKLNFNIEEKTQNAIIRCSSLASELAPERVCAELQQILLSRKPDKAECVIKWGLLDAFFSDIQTIPALHVLKRLPNTVLARWSGFCALLQQSGNLNSDSFLRQIRLPSSIIQCVSSGVLNAIERKPGTEIDWKKIIAFQGDTIARCTAYAMEALEGSDYIQIIDNIIGNGDCVTLRELAIDGEDLLHLGYKGQEIGKTLNRLLEHVIENPVENTRERLMRLL